MGSGHSDSFLVNAAGSGAWLLRIKGCGWEPLSGVERGFEGKVMVGFNKKSFHRDVKQTGDPWFADVGEMLELTGSPGPSEFGKRDPKVLWSGALHVRPFRG